MVRTLGRAVRETLVAKQYLPVLREGRRGSWVGSGSMTSWDEPLGFLERKRDVLLNKRSYSDSDLSKITLNEVIFHFTHPESLFYFSLFLCTIKQKPFLTLLRFFPCRIWNLTHTAVQHLEMIGTGVDRT